MHILKKVAVNYDFGSPHWAKPPMDKYTKLILGVAAYQAN